MRDRRWEYFLFATGACIALALAAQGLIAQTKVQKLPVGAGAIGRVPTRSCCLAMRTCLDLLRSPMP